MAAPLTADEVIAYLKLGPHPEGGYFRETSRDEGGRQGRSHSTAILYLLRAGEVSHWRRVDAAEMGTGMAGTRCSSRSSTAGRGTNIPSARGEHPHALVPAGAWAERPQPRGLDAHRLHRAPGFDFAGFELAPDGFEP